VGAWTTWLLVVVVAGYLGLLWWQWATLPGRVPRHTNAAGQVDAWWSKSAHVWSMLGVGVVLALGGPAVRLVLSRAGSAAKDWINVPHPEYWKSDENFSRLTVALGRLMDVFSALVVGYFGCVVYIMGLAATRSNMPGWWFWTCLAGFSVLVFVWIRWMYRILRVPVADG